MLSDKSDENVKQLHCWDKNDLNGYTTFMDRKTLYYENNNSYQIHLQLNVIFIKFQASLLEKTEKF